MGKGNYFERLDVPSCYGQAWHVRETIERLLDIEIKTIKLPDFEKDIRINGTSKGIRTDIYIEDVNGAIIDVEIQALTLAKDEMGKRARYYQGIIDTDYLPKGSRYTELKKLYIIFICTFDPYGQGRSKYTFTNLCNEDNSLSMYDDTFKIFFNAKGSMKGITQAQRNFLEYVRDGRINDEFIQELDDSIKELKSDEGKKALYMTWTQEILLHEEQTAKRVKLQTIIDSVRNLISNTNYTAVDAVRLLNVPKDLEKQVLQAVQS